MNLLNLFKSFAKDESGAVTVDWVVLTAGIVLLGLAVGQTILPAVNTLTGKIADAVETTPVTP